VFILGVAILVAFWTHHMHLDVDSSNNIPRVLIHLGRLLQMLPVALCRRAVNLFLPGGLDQFEYAARPPRLEGLDLRKQFLTANTRVAISH
jgi:hypothetical protein